ncbi:MAG: hypothetical protein HUU32_21210 [Calditrichaceae bacterium]|nr:hypothetical protein [Calditrichia bacterium]NUQ43915.1 hypothetical protein [Calditrichaceae bacterium]
MRTFKIILKLLSSLRTPFHADTLFGHFCWAMRFLEGEEALKAWLDGFEASPTLISNGFLKGRFPRPLTRPLSLAQLGKLLSFDPDAPPTPEKVIIAGRLKKLKKKSMIEEQWFRDNRENLSPEILVSMLYKQVKEEETQDEKKTTRKRRQEEMAVMHNTFNRQEGRVLEGGLYEFDELCYLDEQDQPEQFWFLVQSETLDEKRLAALMEFIGHSGFGADKSTGKGVIEVEGIEDYPIPECKNPNAFVSLSNFIPAKPEELNGYYQPLTKYGKLGGEYAAGYNPFKKPLVMLQAGALIKDESFTPEKRYGKLQTGVHKDAKIKHYGYGFPIAVHYQESADE